MPGEQSPDATPGSSHPFPAPWQRGAQPLAPRWAAAGAGSVPLRVCLSSEGMGVSETSSRALEQHFWAQPGDCKTRRLDCQEHFPAVLQPPGSLRKARCVHRSLQQPPLAAGAVERQPWQKTPFCCPLPLGNPSLLLLLLLHCMFRPFPGLLPPQPARSSLPHTVNWLDTDKGKPGQEMSPKPPLEPPTHTLLPSKQVPRLEPPALLSPRVQNCSDAFSAAASSPRSSPFLGVEENCHSFTFIPSQVKTLSPSPTPPLGSRDTQHPAVLPVAGWLRRGRYPGCSMRDAIGRAPHKARPTTAGSRERFQALMCALRFAFSCQGDEFPADAFPKVLKQVSWG